MFTIRNSDLPGCLELIPNKQIDRRGTFVKTYQNELYKGFGLQCDFKEQYYTYSIAGVLRGIHFQTPPQEHTKVVYCSWGKVLDVVVDLRVGSPTFKKCALFELSAEQANIIYIPPGLGHGFYAFEPSMIQYNVTSVYHPQHDSGVRWDSIDVPWPQGDIILSERDKAFPSLGDFKSPFYWID